MLFTRALTFETTLPVAVVRSRLRPGASSRGVTDLAAFRRRPIIGWKLSQAGEPVLFQPEYGETLDVEGARLVALVEPLGAGSRIRGRLTVSPLTRVVLCVWILAAVLATVLALGEGRDAPAQVVKISSLMVGVAVVMLRYSLWSTSRVVEARLRQRLDVPIVAAA